VSNQQISSVQFSSFALYTSLQCEMCVRSSAARWRCGLHDVSCL